MLHILKDKFGWGSPEERGFIFNMSAGYNLQGIQLSPTMQRFLNRMQDCSGEKAEKIQRLARFYPRVGMIKRRRIRVLVVYSKTVFFVDKGTQRGVAYETFRKFEEDLNKKLKAKHIRVNALFIPVSRDELLPALIEGRGDIAAANLTITDASDKLVDFTNPILSNVSEIVVTGPESPAIATLDDLAGKEVFVPPSSSYYESVAAN